MQPKHKKSERYLTLLMYGFNEGSSGQYKAGRQATWDHVYSVSFDNNPAARTGYDAVYQQQLYVGVKDHRMYGDCYVPDNRGHTRARVEFLLFDTVLMHRDDNPSVVLRQLDALLSFLRDIDESEYGRVMPGPPHTRLGARCRVPERGRPPAGGCALAPRDGWHSAARRRPCARRSAAHDRVADGRHPRV